MTASLAAAMKPSPTATHRPTHEVEIQDRDNDVNVAHAAVGYDNAIDFTGLVPRCFDAVGIAFAVPEFK